jgi:2-succinyl-6-hydroxy-2,4-cyclohexadiene-1-carboxylate synthase
MGGRAALSFASKYPELIKGLILESTSAGISEERLRNERLDQDQKLAEFIEAHTIGEFVEYWINISLFDSQKKMSAEKQENLKRLKLNNSKTGLANCLKGFSTGMMPPLFISLKDITAKTLLISGSLDLKYTALNKDLVRCFPNSEHIIIKNAGHNVHLEQPVQFADVINDYLKSL